MTECFQCLGHSNRTICILLKPFCFVKVLTFSLSYWEANSYYPRGPIMGKGNSSTSKVGAPVDETDGILMPRAIKLCQMQPLSPIYIEMFPTFSHSYTGSSISLPLSLPKRYVIVDFSKPRNCRMTGGASSRSRRNRTSMTTLKTFR